MTVAAGNTSVAFTINRLDFQLVCFTGLDVPNPPIIVLATPEGAQEDPVPASAGSVPGEWDWAIHSLPGQGPEASLGEYTFHVVVAAARPAESNSSGQDQQSGSPSPNASSSSMTNSSADKTVIAGRFTVIPAARPRVDISPSLLPAGDQLKIAFSGFPGNSVIYVTVYGPGSPPGAETSYPLLADLPGFTTDQNGEALTNWTAPADATSGRYAIWFDPPPTACFNPCIGIDITS